MRTVSSTSAHHRRGIALIVSAAVLTVPALVTTSSATGASPAEPSAASGKELTKPRVSEVAAFDKSKPLRDMRVVAPHKTGTAHAERGAVPRDTGFTGDPAVQATPAVGEAPTLIQSFEGVPNIQQVSPPDPVGDVGPNHYVEMVNLSFAIYNKFGTRLFGPADLGTLWQGFSIPHCSDSAGDPVVLYDQFADRWILTQFTALGPNYWNCIAVSQTPDPLGAYFRYAVPTGLNFPDYPKYGVWPDGLYISTREFAPDDSFAGNGAYVVNKDQLYAGDPNAQVVSFLLPPGNTPHLQGDGLLPTDLDGDTPPPTGSPNYFVGSMDDGGPYGAPFDALNVFEFHVDWATPANSTFTFTGSLPVAPFDSIFPCDRTNSRACIPQPETNNKIDVLSYRQRPIWRLAYRNFGTHQALVTNQSVEARPKIAGTRWYELRNTGSGWSVFQQGTYAPDDRVHRWMGSVAMDENGNMALGYSVSSNQVFPGVRFTGRLASAPLGTMQAEATMIAGTGSQLVSNRWGDYTSMNVDPVDDCTFWYVNQYYRNSSNNGWQTRIGSFAFPGCS
jgi:hypothetical protein